MITYLPKQNEGGGHIPGVALDSMTIERFMKLPPHLRAGVLKSPFYRVSKEAKELHAAAVGDTAEELKANKAANEGTGDTAEELKANEAAVEEAAAEGDNDK